MKPFNRFGCCLLVIACVALVAAEPQGGTGAAPTPTGGKDAVLGGPAGGSTNSSGLSPTSTSPSPSGSSPLPMGSKASGSLGGGTSDPSCTCPGGNTPTIKSPLDSDPTKSPTDQPVHTPDSGVSSFLATLSGRTKFCYLAANLIATLTIIYA